MLVFDAKFRKLEACPVNANLIKNSFSYAKKCTVSHLKPSSGAPRHLLPHGGRRTKTPSRTCKGTKLPSLDVERRVGDESSASIVFRGGH
jgi:hypothetical protein